MLQQLPRSRIKRVGLVALSIFFVGAGINHFVDPDFYVAIVPPYLPAPLSIVYVSGFFEIVGGVAVLARSTRPLAGWGLILLLIAVYPANIHMVLHPEQFPEVPTWALYARLPLQFVFMAWAYWATHPDGMDPNPEARRSPS